MIQYSTNLNAQQQVELLGTSESIALVLYDRHQRIANTAKRMIKFTPEWQSAQRDIVGYFCIADTVDSIKKELDSRE